MEKFFSPISPVEHYRNKLKGVLLNDPDSLDTIVKHKNNMIELLKVEHGETKDRIEQEIFDCHRFIRKYYRKK